MKVGAAPDRHHGTPQTPWRRDADGGSDDPYSSCGMFVPDAYARHAAQAHLAFIGLILPLGSTLRSIRQVIKSGIPLFSKQAAYIMVERCRLTPG